MKTLPVGLAAHIASGTTTLADLLKITRTDGTVFAFTSAANDVTISSVLYKSAQGLNISSLEASAGLNVDNLELSTLDDGTVFTKLDVLSGRWRNADFVISRYNWSSPSDGVDVRMVGTIGEVRLHRGYVTAELRGLQQYLQQPIGSVSSKTCRARLGDAMCTKDLIGFTYLAEVSAVTSNQVFTVSDVGGGGSGDADFASVQLLLHANGVDGSTSIIDSSLPPKTVTAVGNSRISTTQNKFGGSSLYFDGTGDYLTVPDSADFDFVSGNFTAEAFVYVSAYGGALPSIIIGKRANGLAYAPFLLYVSASGNLGGLASVNGATWGVNLLSASAIGTGAWKHVAFVRNGTSFVLYLEGVNVGSGSLAGSLMVNTSQLCIGANVDASHPLNGYIDELRITKGAAFTPPTAEFLESIPSAFPATDDWFANGLASWTSGNNDGLQVKVKTSTSGHALTLSLPMLANITVGDTLTLVAGCQKRLTDCATKFSNVLNFQGEPHLPGIDEVVQ